MGHLMYSLARESEGDSQLLVYACWCDDQPRPLALCKYYDDHACDLGQL